MPKIYKLADGSHINVEDADVKFFTSSEMGKNAKEINFPTEGKQKGATTKSAVAAPNQNRKVADKKNTVLKSINSSSASQSKSNLTPEEKVASDIAAYTARRKAKGLNTNYSPEQIKAKVKIEADSRKNKETIAPITSAEEEAYKKYRQNRILTQADVDEVAFNVAKEKEFKTKADKIRDESWTGIGAAVENLFTSDSEDKYVPFAAERKQALAEAKIKNQKLTKEQLDIIAEKKYKFNQYKNVVNKKSEQYLKDIDGDEQDLLESRGKKSIIANKKRIATQNMLSKDLAGYDYEFKKLQKELSAYGKNPKFSTQQEVDNYNFKVKELKDLQGFAKNTYEAYKGNLEDYDKSNDKLGSPEEEYDLAKRHYGIGWELTKPLAYIENFVEGAVGVVSMLNDATTYLPRKVANSMMGEETDFLTSGTKSILEFKREREKIQEGFYAKPREVENVETFMEKGWDLVASQVPNIILMALTGGGSKAVTLAGEEAVALAGREAAVAGTEAAVAGVEAAEVAAGLGGKAIATEVAEGIGTKLTNSAKWLDKLKATRVGNTVVKAATLEGTASKTIAASAAGSKYLDLADTNEKGITNYSPIQMVASSLLYGYAEGAGENVTTDIFKGAIRPLKALGDDVSKQAFMESLKKETIAKWFGKKGIDMLNENISEQVTNIAQNSIDKFMLGKDVGILDNTGTVFKDTTLLTGLMIGAPQVAGLAIKPFIKPTTQQKMRDNSSEIARLMVSMNDENITPATLKAYQAKAQALTEENAVIVQTTIDRIGGMPDNTYKNMLSLDQERRDLQVEAGKIMKSNESEQSKAQAINILSEQYKAKAEQLNDLQANIELMDGISSAYEPKVRKDIYNLLIKAKDINTSMKSLNELQQTEAKQELKGIQDQLVQYSDSRILNEAENKKNNSLLNKNLEFASTLADKIRGGVAFDNAIGEGKSLIVANTEAEAQALYSKFLEQSGKADEKFDGIGVKLSNGQILINREYALAANQFNVGGHEVLHVVLQSQFNNLKQEEATALKDKFLSVLSEKERALLDARILAKDIDGTRFYSDAYLAKHPDEYLTQFFEVVAEGKLTWSDKLADMFFKIGKLILPFFKEQGFPNLEFKDGKDVYDFIKSYNKDIRRGNINERALALGKKGIDTEASENAFSKFELKDMASKIDRHVTGTGVTTNQEFRESPKTAGWFFEIEENRQFESYLKSMITADKNLGGLDSDIKEDVLRQLKETIQDRILKNYTPVLDGKERSLFSYIYGKGDSNGTGGIAYKSLLDIKKKYATSTDNVSMDYQDGTTADFADESITTEELTDLALAGEMEAPSSKLRRELKANGKEGIDQDLIDQLRTDVEASLIEANIDPTDKGYRKKLIDLYRAKLKAPIAKLIGGGDAYGKFLKDNKETLIENLPVSYFVQIERLKPENERIFSSPVKRLTTQAEIDKYTNLGLAYTESDASGPWLYKKLMPSDEAIAEFYGTNPGSKLGSTKGTRKDELARIIGVTLASDMTPTVLREKEQAGEISTADKNKIAERLQRDPDLKFSKAFRKILNLKNTEMSFSNSKQVGEARAGLVQLFKTLNSVEVIGDNKELRKISPKEIINYFVGTARGGWGSTSGEWEKGKFSPKAHLEILSPSKNEGKWRWNRYLMIGTVDFFNLFEAAFPELNIEYTKGSKYATIDSEKIDLDPTPPQTASDFAKGTMFIGKNKTIKERNDYAYKQQNHMKNIATALKDLYKTGMLNANQVGMILATFNSSTKALIRTAAPITHVPKVIDPNGEYRYEHYQTASTTLAEILRWITDDTGTVDLDNILNGFGVAVIPVSHDNILNKYYKSEGPKENGILKLGTYDNIQRYSDKEFNKALKAEKLKPLNEILVKVDYDFDAQKVSEQKFSKAPGKTFNEIIEANKGVSSVKVFSDITARRRGAKTNIFDVYVPPSAADFELLLYKFLGKGKEGEEQKKFFDEMLLKPYAHGNDLMDAARQSIKNGFKELLDAFPGIKKKLETLIPDGDYTYDQAIRVAMWADEEVEIPGISKRDIDKLVKLVNEDAQLKEFKDRLIVTGRQGKGWISPEKFWDANTIISDLHNLTEGVGRKKFLSEFIENVEEIFGKWEEGRLVGPNMNKIEAVYGTNVREALEDVIYRMTAGKNRGYGSDKDTTAWNNWVNGSTGTIMFLNTRSAVLQLIGAFNFLNLRDNNPYAAAKAFANQKQYWEDFATIWNSDKMKERRGGLKEDVAAAEIANAAAGSKNKVNAVVSYLLKIGYTPTQLADSFAIASGGAPYYRNRIKSYIKEGLSEQEAQDKAWDDFTKISDETQQSGDPRDISKQQASAAGRLLLTFQNTAMQQARIVKKSFLDLKNGRGDAKTHVAKIAYYLAIQNVMFSVLQQGLFAAFFDDDEEKDAKAKKEENKALGLADDVLDTILRGSGFTGGIIATLKNMGLKYLDEKDKNFKADYAKVVLEGANISPPIGSKLRKLYSGFQQTKFDRDLIAKRGWGIMQDGRVHLGPNYSITGKLVESTTNLPMDRFVNKVENVSQALNSQNEAWQRVMVGLGWNPYSLGIDGSAADKVIKEEAKAERKEQGVEKAKATREATKKAEEEAYEKLPQAEKDKIAFQKFNEKMKKFEEKVKKEALEEANMTPDQIALRKFQKKQERKAKSNLYKERKLRAQKIRDSINFDAYMKKQKNK